jgi:anti-anti-sigma factor
MRAAVIKPIKTKDEVMPIESRRDSGTLIIQTEERVDSANAQAFYQELDSAIESDDRAVVMDMERLAYISSAGLRVILQTARKLQQQNAKFAICSLSGTVREVFEISGFDRVIDIHSSQEDAIAAVSG